MIMFLAKEHIEKLCGIDGLISPDTYSPDLVRQASYDLRLGEEAYIVGSVSPVWLSKGKAEYLTIAPGQFALLTCHEFLSIPPNILGLISLRNSYKMQGLVNISGFHVDPTFTGRLVFAVNNVGPSDIRLRLLEPTFTIFFAEVGGDVGKPRSAHPDRLPLESIQHLGGSSVTLSKLQKDLEDLKTKVLMYAPLGIALLIALLLNLLKK
jgi:dCTP deaminase